MNHDIRIPINQPVMECKAVFFRGSLKGVHLEIQGVILKERPFAP